MTVVGMIAVEMIAASGTGGGIWIPVRHPLLMGKQERLL
jgi:hypothetical protein